MLADLGGISQRAAERLKPRAARERARAAFEAADRACTAAEAGPPTADTDRRRLKMIDTAGIAPLPPDLYDHVDATELEGAARLCAALARACRATH